MFDNHPAPIIRALSRQFCRGKHPWHSLWHLSIAWLAIGSLILGTALPAQVTNIKLSGPLAPTGNVHEFQISPDGSRVVYRADQEVDGVSKLYVVPTAGGDPVKLNSPLVTGGDVRSDYAFSPDGRHVAYLADQEADNVTELYASSGFREWRIYLPVVLSGR